jgi:hypothetical protein
MPSGDAGATAESVATRTTALTQVGTWTHAPNAPFVAECTGGNCFMSPNSLALMTDGTVLVSDEFGHWFRLTPDAFGRYETGTWQQVADSHFARLDNPSTTLRDGRYLIAGGEIVSHDAFASGEIYDPYATDPAAAWTRIADMPEGIQDTATSILPDGTFYSSALRSRNAYTYDPVGNTWTATGTIGTDGDGAEKGFLLMPNGKLLDAWTPGATYDATSPTHTWVQTGPIPVSLNTFETGPTSLLYSGKVMAFGAADLTMPGQVGGTAIYDPASNQWTAGPNAPDGLQFGDTPADVMPNGHVLCATQVEQSGGDVSSFWEYDPDATTNPFTPVPFPFGQSSLPRFLQLPTGQVMMMNFRYPQSVDIYNPVGPFITAGAPTISSVSASTSLGAVTVSGTGLNGLTHGATFGDEMNSGTAFPLVYLQDAANHKYYGRTFDFSTMAPAPGPGSFQAVLPATLPDGTSIPNGTYVLHLTASGMEAVPPLPTITLGTRVTGLSGGATVLDPNQTTTWTVTLDANAPHGGIVVDLSALKALDAQGHRTVDIATVPASVTVPFNRRTATFTVRGVQAGYTVIYATARTNVARTATRDFGTKLTSLTGSPLPPAGSNATPLSLLFTTPIPSTGMTVYLTSSDPSVATTGSPYFMVGGSTSAVVWVNLLAPGSATITATLPGSSVSCPVGYAVTSISGPTVPSSGNTAEWTVSIDSSVGSGQSPVTVSLSSSNTARATVPSSVQITSGNSASFTVTQGNDLNEATITASAGSTSEQATFGYRVTQQTVTNGTISVSGTPVSTDVTFYLSAQAPSEGLMLPLAANDGNGNSSNFVTLPPTVSVAPGATSFTVTATAANPGTGFVVAGNPEILGSVKLFTVVP